MSLPETVIKVEVVHALVDGIDGVAACSARAVTRLHARSFTSTVPELI